MSTEHKPDPEILRALDTTYEELRAAEFEMLPMPEENERLRARLERLQHGRKELRSILRLGQSGLEPHLPGTLQPPFQVQSSLSEARRMRDVLSLLLSGSIALLLPWALGGRIVGAAVFWLAVVSAIRLFRSWGGGRSWAFLEEFIEVQTLATSRGTPTRVKYSQVFDAEARQTPAQQRRGVGTLVVKYQPKLGGAQMSILLENVPEPERLAKWLLSRSKSARLTAGK